METIKEKSIVLKIFINVLTVAILTALAIGILYLAKHNYVRDDITYTTNLIINNTNVTTSLKNNLYIEDETVYISEADVYNFFDDTIFYDKKYNQIITSSSNAIATLPIGNNNVKINSINTQILKAAIEKDGTYFIPISELGNVYNIKTKYVESTNIVFIDSQDREQSIANLKSNVSIKYKPTFFSRTLTKAKKGETLTLANRSDYPVPEGWTRVRNEEGIIGYIKLNKINKQEVINEATKENKKIEGKVSLAWDYFSEYVYAPKRTQKINGINVVSPSFFYMDSEESTKVNTNIEEQGNEYIKWAHENKYKIWPMLTNSTMKKTSEMLADYKLREQVINQIAQYIKQYNLDGINIDFEGMYEKDKDNFSRFLIELKPRLNQLGAALSVDVTAPDGAPEWSLCYDRHIIGKTADYIVFMAYDQYGITSNKAGTTAGCDWVEANISKFLGQEDVKLEKLILAVPFYTMLWQEKNGKLISEPTPVNIGAIDRVIPNGVAKNWDESLQQYYVEYRENGITHKLWVEDEKSIEAKLNLVSKYNLAGAGYWELDRSTSSIWNLVSKKINIQ